MTDMSDKDDAELRRLMTAGEMARNDLMFTPGDPAYLHRAILLGDAAMAELANRAMVERRSDRA